ncbi:hypothetical protein Hypma_009876 [Hypsizygus marmoreus]|uniref:SUN domain-containing protein n=1 Tax=Hypsizygus marmoreus TaxID=39966 RepID=A0A369JWI9_HYPMA|nr:hypothetical protein Hypma_009876 [Hypsizygus marmoreus]
MAEYSLRLRRERFSSSRFAEQPKAFKAIHGTSHQLQSPPTIQRAIVAGEPKSTQKPWPTYATRRRYLPAVIYVAISTLFFFILGRFVDIDAWILRYALPSPPTHSALSTRRALDIKMASEGATIVETWTSPSLTPYATPNTLLDGSHSALWCFTGATGRIGLLLSAPSIPSHISISTHNILSFPSRPLSLVAPTAPRDIIVWGYVDGASMRKKLARIQAFPQPSAILGSTRELFVPIARGEYDGRIWAPNNQKLPVDPVIVDSSIPFGLILLEIRSNWGGLSTCLDNIQITAGVAR